MFTPRADDQLKEVLPSSPIAGRTFQQNDELALFVEMYDHAGSAHEITLVSSVVAADGRVAYSDEETIASSDLDAVKRSYAYSGRIPLVDIAPGAYVLKLEARSSAGNSTARQIGFTVTPGLARGK